MRLLTRQLKDDHNFFFVGDLHDGSVLSYTKGWDKMVSMVTSEYEGCSDNFVVDGGDMFEAIMVDDPRFSEDKLTEPLPLAQTEEAIRKREPIKDKLITILMGNHERKLWRFGNLTKYVCDKLGVEYGTYTAKITVMGTDGKLMYKVYDTHGMRTITSTADDPKRRHVNMELILKRQLKFKAGDCAVMIKHHAHKLIVCKPEKDLYLVDDGKRIRQKYTSPVQKGDYIPPDLRWYGVAGSFLRLYGDGMSGYAEMLEYDPNEMGFLVLIVRQKQIVELRPVYL
uniref:Putative DNA repair exonuclease n=1 Tax=viral metagenome TaxID=1070528 RepID=A0A6M3J1B0_9ZZZZ